MLGKVMRGQRPLKSVYYASFLLFIVIPLLLVLIGALFYLNQQFKGQALENIRRAQETVVAELLNDVDIMSMRLSHLIYTNNNEILAYAAGTDTADAGVRYDNERRLHEAVSLALEPVKDVVSVGFYMKDGRVSYIKNDIKLKTADIRTEGWYEKSLERANTVCVGSYVTAAPNDLFAGSRKDMLILVFALAPDVSTDRSQKIEMVAYYQVAGAGDRIKKYNADYEAGGNKLGITRIIDESGTVIYATGDVDNFGLKGQICVRTPVELFDNIWYVESYIKESELTADYMGTALFVLGAFVLVFLLAGYFSRYFLKSIVHPVEEISAGLRQVEEGNLQISIAPDGQFEIRTMIHQFNAMVRRLKVLILEYEERVKNAEKSPEDYFAAMLLGEQKPVEVYRTSNTFFKEDYALLAFCVTSENRGEDAAGLARQLAYSFERNPRFASRCVLYQKGPGLFLIYYRIGESDHMSGIRAMSRELQAGARQEFDVRLFVLIGRRQSGYGTFLEQVAEVEKGIILRYLKGENAVVFLEESGETDGRILALASAYEGLAQSLYIADEKNMLTAREALFDSFHSCSMEQVRVSACAAILAVAIRFGQDGVSLAEAFGQQPDYTQKVERIEDKREMKLWLTNFFAWLMDYSASRLNASETDAVIRAKRYIADNYEDAELSLSRVAEHVGLNEKYFTNRFTRETGETFSAYVSSLRMEKAKELLRTTSFKVYEIAEMSGYHSVEHFNRVFKKQVGISPMQYRKSDK